MKKLLPVIFVFFAAFANQSVAQQKQPEIRQSFIENSQAVKQQKQTEIRQSFIEARQGVDLQNQEHLFPGGVSNFDQYFKKSALSGLNYGNTPEANWGEQFGGSASDNIRATRADDDGNVYVAGYFSGEITVGEELYITGDRREAFVAMYDATGSLQWFRQISEQSETGEVYPVALNLDADGNIIVTGYFTGETTMGSRSLFPVAGRNFFLAKLDPTGEFVFATGYGQSNAVGKALVTDADGNIYVVASAEYYFSSRNPSIFMKYNPDGNLAWKKDFDEGLHDIAIVGNEIWLAGVNIGNDGGYLDENISLGTPVGYHDIFLATTDLDGVFTWGYMLLHNDYGRSNDPYIDVSDDGGIYLAGYTEGLTSFQSLDVNYNGLFLARFDMSTMSFVWVNNVPGYNTPRDVVSSSADGAWVTDGSSFIFIEEGGFVNPEASDYSVYSMDMLPTNTLILSGISDGMAFLSAFDELQKSETWVVEIPGNAAYSEVIGMVTDDEGDVYMYGYASQALDYFGSQLEKGLFISRHNGAGAVKWIEQFPGIRLPYGSQGNFLNIDTIADYLYFTGVITEDLIIPGETTLDAAEEGSVFIIKMDLDGNYISHVKEDFAGEEPTVVPDNQGNVILGLTYRNNAKIGSNLYQANGRPDGLLVKYDENFNVLWEKSVRGDDYEYMMIASADLDGNIYISTESYSEILHVGDDVFTLNEGDGNVFVARLSGDGTLQWGKTLAGSMINSGDYGSWPTGIMNGPDGNIYIKGWTGDSAYFDDIVVRSRYGYGYSYFVTKLTADGDVLWANTIEETMYGFDYNQFDIDRDGSVYLGAQVRDTIYFGEEYMYVNAGGYDLFVAKYTSGGELDYVITMQSPGNGYNWISSVKVFGNENLFVSGFFTGRFVVDNREFNSYTRHGFLMMFGPDLATSTGPERVVPDAGKVAVYPNPSEGIIHVTQKSDRYTFIRLYNPAGQLLYSAELNGPTTTIDLHEFPNGVYFIQVGNSSESSISKLLLE